jgi:glycosyltransferase involved in cell wall biosynthesis
VTKSGFPFRNALADYASVPSNLVLEGSDQTQPLVTIAIPTFRRPDFLVEAVESAMNQRFDRPVEILVFDNDPDSTGAEELLRRLPNLAQRNFRYFVNFENIGMFGNWNRCIEHARGEWLTILNDDDLLDEDCLAIQFKTLDKMPQVDGLICRKRSFHQRTDQPAPASITPRTIAKRLLLELLFAGRRTRRIPPRKLFWGAIIGNGAGLVFRRKLALRIGGFYAEEFPSADYWFALRLSKLGHFRQHRAVAASYRVAENETGNPATVRKSLVTVRDLREAMIGEDVPRWWGRFSPMVSARDIADYGQLWKVPVPKEEAEQMLGSPLPPHRPYLLWTIRILLRGF